MFDILDKFLKNIRPAQHAPFLGEGYEYHFVYCIINKINKKLYIGKHSTKNLDDNYLGSGYHIQNSINKYGKDNFYLFIIKFFTSSLDAYNYEQSLITEEMVESKDCFNWKGGGEGFGDYDTNPMVICSKNGTHPWLGNSNPVHKMPKEWRESIQNHPKVIENQARWKLYNPSVEKIKNGTHQFLGASNPSKDYPWKRTCVKSTSLPAWADAERLYNLYIENNRCGEKLLSKVSGISRNHLITITKKFKKGWIPVQDVEWNQFKQEYFIQNKSE